MVVRISDKTQNYSKVTKLLVKPIKKHGIEKAIIKFCGLELAESQILKLILQYYNEFKKEKK